MNTPTMKLTELFDLATAHRKEDATFFVAIDSHGGAGKSTLAEKLALADPGAGATVVQIDDFYRPTAARHCGNPEHAPTAADVDLNRLVDQVLRPLSSRGPTSYQRYDWDRDQLVAGPSLARHGVVIVEGVYALSLVTRAWFQFSIWVSSACDTRVRRGIERDGEGMRSEWEDNWMRREDAYCQREDPRAAAHIIVSGESDSTHFEHVTVLDRKEKSS